MNPGASHGVLRTRLEAAPVGRDAARHVMRDSETTGEGRKEGTRRPTSAPAPGTERVKSGSSHGADRSREPRGERERGGSSEPSPSRWTATVEKGNTSRSSDRKDGRDSRGKPGEQFIPELYYKEARNKPMPGEEDDTFFQRGALKPQQYAILIGVLGLILLTLVFLIVWLIV